jgi:hypothetical protein
MLRLIVRCISSFLKFDHRVRVKAPVNRGKKMKERMTFKACRIIIFSIMGTLGVTKLTAETKVPNQFTSGSPAKAEEVNENFAVLELAVNDHWSRYPYRYYPNWRYDPTFYLTLPSLGNNWGGRLLSDRGFRMTSDRNLNFINRYDPENRSATIWFGIDVLPSPDFSASWESRSKSLSGAADVYNGVQLDASIERYSFGMSHHKDYVFSNITFTYNSSLSDLIGSVDWQNALSRETVETLLSDVYDLLKVSDPSVAVYCGSINFNLESNLEISVIGSSCSEITTSQN